MHFKSAFSAPPPSRVSTGHKFIKAKERLHILKNEIELLVTGAIICGKTAKIKLKIIPPKHTKSSLL
jgi:hypothetical protein